MKTWAKWTLLILWTGLLLLTANYWNPFTSFPALLKYSVVSVIGAGIFGALVLIIQYFLIISIVFPLPPRADAQAPKSFWRRLFPWMFKESTIDPKAPQTLSELIGNDQAKMEIKEVIDMISHPEQYQASGAQVPKGILFVGPPGVGKTLFARAIANEVGIPFYVLDSSSLSAIFIGVGVLRLKTLFAKLRKHQKVILFMDEIDSMAARRSKDQGFGGIADMNMTLNTLLTEMDGFHASNILVIGATNNDGILDPALMRPGRMDRRIYFQPPNPDERQELFRYYLNKVLHADDVNLAECAKLTTNYSPAEIAGVINEAALIARRPNGPGKVTMETLQKALDRVAVGLERTMVGSGIEISNTDASIRLDDVIGIDDVKQDVLEIIDFLQHGDELQKIGAKVPRGVLLIGPPGVGKTMLAKAIANAAGVPFYGMSASYLRGMLTGEGAGRIRALYSQARKSPASIVFIDEIDALGSGGGDTGTARTTALNQILVELDGLTRSNVITIGATNIEQSLDPAFMRSGRFDRKCYVGLPDSDARKKIFAKYVQNVKVEPALDLDQLAKVSTNFSGADIAATVNEAAIIAVRQGRSLVSQENLEEAVDRVSITAGHKLNTYGMNLSRVPDLDVKLDDVKGMDAARAEAAEVVALLRNYDRIQASGLKSVKGVLLVGPPGTGKTMLAKAIANEAGVPFYALSGGDFQSMWAGVGANRVRAVYEQARRSGKPAIVFIDEIDALAAKRGIDMGGGAIQDSNKTLNQFLVELDGFGKHKVLTIGATNNPNMLDPALLRPGRFDRRIDVPLPNLEGREAILAHYLKRVKVDDRVNPIEIARMTTFHSGADIANIVNEAGLIAIRSGRTAIEQRDLMEAIQRVNFGMSFHGHVLLEELMATAYHEAGHAIVSYFRDRRSRIQIITVIPSGPRLGYTWPVSKEDYTHQTKQDFLTDIEVALAGYAAENLYLETTTNGVGSDLQNVAMVVKHMVKECGMGPFKFNTEVAFGHRPSPETERELELEMKRITDSCLDTAESLLRAHRAELDKLAHCLVEKETLYYRDIVSILEPHRSETDISKELAEIAARKLVGKELKLNLGAIMASESHPRESTPDSGGTSNQSPNKPSPGSKADDHPSSTV